VAERVETRLVTGGRAHGPGAPLGQSLVMSSTYRLGGDLEYGRDGNETWAALEGLVGELEGGHAVAFGSGLAACAAVLDAVPGGGTIVAPRSAYHGFTDQLRAREAVGRLTVRWVDIADPRAVAEAARDAAMVWLETPSNPLMAIADIAAAAAACEAGSLLVVDSTFATPLLQRPIEHGADIVIHSATKYIGGHADLLLGLAVCREPSAAHELWEVRHREGSIPGSLEAFLALRGLRTLGVRLERAQANAGELAARLAAHPAVTRVRYPGLSDDPGHAVASRQMDGYGAMLSFETQGDADAADAVCQRVRVISAATSLGGIETLIDRRARYESERLSGTPPTLMRLSVGIEHVEDLWADLGQALQPAVSSGAAAR
jgi:cystathionine gamma-synthase